MAKNTQDTDLYVERLAKVIGQISDDELLQAFLKDILTPAEQKDLWERWNIVDLLLKGNSQREIKEQLKVSISKVTRGSREVQFGTGGFRKVWNHLQKK